MQGVGLRRQLLDGVRRRILGHLGARPPHLLAEGGAGPLLGVGIMQPVEGVLASECKTGWRPPPPQGLVSRGPSTPAKTLLPLSRGSLPVLQHGRVHPASCTHCYRASGSEGERGGDGGRRGGREPGYGREVLVGKEGGLRNRRARNTTASGPSGTRGRAGRQPPCSNTTPVGGRRCPEPPWSRSSARSREAAELHMGGRGTRESAFGRRGQWGVW